MKMLSFYVAAALGAAVSFFAGLFLSARKWRQWHDERVDCLLKVSESEREVYRTQIDTERRLAHEERRELYSRIQAYDPYMGQVHPTPSITVPSRPDESMEGPRSYTEEELSQMGLAHQADGLIRDTRSSALFESVEDWRFWIADLKKRGLPENVHPEIVRESGWEEAASVAREQAKRRAEASKS